jgi:glycolate oxidase FAD binding subunit
MRSDPALTRLIDQVQRARATRTPLCIRGGGTKDFYGEAPRGELLAVGDLRGITAYEPTELVVTVRAGTPLAELEAALAEKGQCLAFEPPRFQNAADSALHGGTVGGMVAAGLAGPSRAAVGGVRDYVLGACLLNGHCEVLRFGGQVMKNVAGYDVSRVLAGSLGILGPILEVSLKVLPRAPATATLRFEWPQAKALAQLNLWAGQPLPIQASAWWNDMLVLRLAGAAAAVQAAQRTLGGEVIAPALAQTFWDGLRDQRDEFFAEAASAVQAGARLWRMAVAQTAPPLQAQGQQLIEWGGAQRWFVSSAPVDVMRTLARDARGHASVFRGDRSGGAFAPLAPALHRIHRHLKAAFDPEGLFNPGRLVADL